MRCSVWPRPAATDASGRPGVPTVPGDTGSRNEPPAITGKGGMSGHADQNWRPAQRLAPIARADVDGQHSAERVACARHSGRRPSSVSTQRR
jgi:hypothetical protein